ncbi:MAG: TetR/AcrR family transcriptional regulator [Eubacteriaceae bacterium]|nr:TetR/AcrR family transcriptional regulator [Eubacteriaceae bacterium]
MKNRYSSGIETENRIYDAARRLFYKNGLSKTTNKEIAEQAFVHKSLVNHYYENKEKLFMEIVSDYIKTIYGYAEKIVSDDPRLLPVMYIICLYHMIISDRKICRMVNDYFETFNIRNARVNERYVSYLRDLHNMLYGEKEFQMPDDDTLYLYRISNISFTRAVARSIIEEDISFDCYKTALIDMLNKITVFGKDAYERFMPIFEEAAEKFRADPFSSRIDFSEDFAAVRNKDQLRNTYK